MEDERLAGSRVTELYSSTVSSLSIAQLSIEE